MWIHRLPVLMSALIRWLRMEWFQCLSNVVAPCKGILDVFRECVHVHDTLAPELCRCISGGNRGGSVHHTLEVCLFITHTRHVINHLEN